MSWILTRSEGCDHRSRLGSPGLLLTSPEDLYKMIGRRGSEETDVEPTPPDGVEDIDPAVDPVATETSRGVPTSR